MASLVGQAVGGPRLPWNARKGWVGLASFVVFGAAAAAFLAGVDATAAAAILPRAHWPRTLGVAAGRSRSRCAIVESLPTTLDDNLTVPLAVVLLLPLLAAADPGAVLADPLTPRRLAPRPRS